jgi:hypothetical protein
MAISVEYPSFTSGEPVRLSAEAIRTLGADLRRRMLGFAIRPVEPADLFRRAARLRVNGLPLRLVWDAEHPVHDEAGAAVLGVCEHDPQEPGEVTISLNSDLLEGRPELLRSTAAHELGHAIFDMPAAMNGEMARAFRSRTEGRVTGEPIDWREWRADEFMGAFLAPRRQITRAFMREASAIGASIAWRGGDSDAPTPCMKASRNGWSAIEAIVTALAGEFGLSESFIAVRLRKYGMIAD